MGLELAAAEQWSSYGDWENVDFTDSQLVSHVRDALSSAREGDVGRYSELVGVLRHNNRLTPDEVAALETLLRTLRGAISCLDIVHHRSLLDAIFSLSLWNYNFTSVMDAIVELVISLAASSAKYVDFCLDMLVHNFVPPEYLLEFMEKPCNLRRKDQVLDRVHSTLKKIADLVPLSPLRLEKIIRERMPTIHVKHPRLIVMYVENMLRLESGALGELVGSSMLVAVVDRLIDLDVEIAWDDILQDDFSRGIFDMEMEDLECPEDDFKHDGDELPRQSWIQKFFGGSVIAEMLDSLMVVTFEHLNFSNESGRLLLVFESLLQSFQITVLTAYKSKFAQFVIFYACSLDPENCGEKFAVTLLDTFMSSNFPQWRMSAVAYLASYLSRAKFVSAHCIAKVLRSLVNWCSEYCKNQDGETNPRAHKVFYAGCQAFMYVLCFRMRSMISIPGFRSLQMRIDDILKHPLNPLKVCLPSIVEEFLRVAKSCHVFAVLEHFVPKGLMESDYSMAFGGLERLDMFFPFDPCLLKKSDRFIRPNFIYWSMVRSINDEQDDDDEEDGSSDDDASVVSEHSKPSTIHDDPFRSDDEYSNHDDDFGLDKMSITPKNTLSYHFGGGKLQPCIQMPSKIMPSSSP